MKKKYYKLIKLITKYGFTAPKEHGEYIYVYLYDETMIWLDTWNAAIWIIDKKTQRENYLGLDFGGFECHLPQLIDWSIAHINMSNYKNTRNETKIQRNLPY